jgi:hypothetical protein
VPDPLRRFQTRYGACAMSPPYRLPLVGLRALRSVVCARPPGTSGSPGSASASTVSGRPARLFFVRRPPPLFSERVHPPVSLSFPCRVLPLACPPRRCSFDGAPSRGSPPSSRHQPQASTRYGLPRPRTRSVLGVSHALDGLLRLWPCEFISPRCHVQDSPFRGFPPGEAVPPRRWPIPS